MLYFNYKKFPVIILLIFLSSTSVFAADPATSSPAGLIKLQSNYDVPTTINRLKKVLMSKGMTIFKRVDHKAGADKAGLQLRPTQLLIFGNPKVGTPLMLCSQTSAIDLPQKALAYQDDKGRVWLAYNDPQYLADRHNIKGCQDAIRKVSKALAKFVHAATE